MFSDNNHINLIHILRTYVTTLMFSNYSRQHNICKTNTDIHHVNKIIYLLKCCRHKSK